MRLIKKCCFSCDQIILDDEVFYLDCSCNYCKNCLVEKIKEITDNHYVLNSFEKGNKKVYYISLYLFLFLFFYFILFSHLNE
jgi:hypothetical protein